MPLWPDYTKSTGTKSARDMLTLIIRRCLIRGAGEPANTEWGLILGHALVCRAENPAPNPNPGPIADGIVHGNHFGGKNDDELWDDVKAAYDALVLPATPTPAQITASITEIDHQGAGGGT